MKRLTLAIILLCTCTIPLACAKSSDITTDDTNQVEVTDTIEDISDTIKETLSDIDDNDDGDADSNTDLTLFISNKDNLKLAKDEFENSKKEMVNEEQHVSGQYTYITKTYDEVRSFDEQVVFSKSDIIYPGAILRGDALLTNEYVPLNMQRNPIDISLSLQGDIKTKDVIEDPRTVSAARETINRLLNQDGLEGAAALSFQVSEVNSAEQFDMELGIGIGVKDIKFGFGMSPSATFEKSKKFAQFTQRYYSISADRPTYLSGFFKENTQADDFYKECNGYMPVYVSSVVYGRRGIFELETNSSSNDIEYELNASTNISGIDIDGKFKDDIKKSMDTMDMKLFILGGDSETAVQAISSYDNFIHHIQSGSHFSPSNRGEIIGFELRYLHDDSLAKLVINETYQMVEKVARESAITYDVNYVKLNAPNVSGSINIRGLEVFINQDSDPLWKNSDSKVSGATTRAVQTELRMKHNELLPFSQLRQSRTTSDGKGKYFYWQPKQIQYANPDSDTVQFSATVNGNFTHNPTGSFFGDKTENFNINLTESINIKDIADQQNIILTVTSDSYLDYSFEIGLDIEVIYEDHFSEAFSPQLTPTQTASGMSLSWVLSNSSLDPKFYVIVSDNNPNPSYPKDGFTLPELSYKNTYLQYLKLEPGMNDFTNGDFDEIQSGGTYYVAVSAVYDDGKVWTSNVEEITIP